MFRKKVRHPLLWLCSAMLLFATLFVGGTIQYSSKKVDEAFTAAQSQISILIDIRTKMIEDWVAEQVKPIRNVADNITVKIFLTQLGDSKQGQRAQDRMTQEQFISNYLNSVSHHSGYKNNQRHGRVPANIERKSSAGLAVFNKQGQFLVGVDMANNIKKMVQSLSQDLFSKDKPVFKTYINGRSSFIVVSAPIRHVQAEDILGYTIGVKKLDDRLFSKLSFPPDNKTTSSSDIITRSGARYTTLNETQIAGLNNVLRLEQADQVAEIFAINHPGEIAIKKDAELNKVLIATKAVKATDQWYVSYKISQDEVLGAVIAERIRLVIIALLTSLALFALILYAWKRSKSQRYERLYNEYLYQAKLLGLINQHQIQSMCIIDDEGVFLFANDNFAKIVRSKTDTLVGKNMEDVMGVSKAEKYKKHIEETVKKKKPISITSQKKQRGGAIKYIEDKFIPIQHIPIPSMVEDDYIASATLVVENDISDIMAEQRKNEQNLSDMVETLIHIIEERSRYHLNHSKKVVTLALLLAKKLKLEGSELKALGIAAKIHNLYLVLLPEKLVNKKTALTKAELETLKNGPAKTAEIIKDIEFDCPVVDTILQTQERVDGSGKTGLKGNDIMESAKTLKVVDDFIALTSSRSYRKAISKEDAIESMLKEKEKKYDSVVIYALASAVAKEEF